MKTVFTVCNRHQLRQALTLGESLQKHHPDYRFLIGWTDQLSLVGMPDWAQVIKVEEIDKAPWQEMSHRYYDFELTAACKPFFARHILNQAPDSTELVYLAPCTWILGSMDPVLNPSVFFQATPHRLLPIATPGQLDDKAILNIGMFHAGSWVLHPDGQEKELLDWWCERTSERAFFDLCNGMCLDQLWMNYLPVLFQGVVPIRNAGWHYGLHAMPGHRLSKHQNSYLVNLQPLISVDFSGVECYHPVWSDHAGLADAVDYWAELHTAYRARVAAQKVPSFDTGSIPFGKISVVKPFRKQRKKVIGFLDRVIGRIETYDLTHN